MSLRDFLAADHNSVTREHMFYNRLYYDLKLAAAYRNYPLAVFAPEVDRDGYDVILDDGDYERRFQLKTVLKDAGTSRWETRKGLLRASEAYAEKMHLESPLCGFGGGIILIEIDASTEVPTIQYLFTDYFVIAAFEARLWLEQKADNPVRGRPAQLRADIARGIRAQLWQGERKDVLNVPWQCFLRARSTDALLALLGMHNNSKCYLPSNSIADALSAHFEADADGNPCSELKVETLGLAYAHAVDILRLTDEPNLRVFTWAKGEPPEVD